MELLRAVYTPAGTSDGAGDSNLGVVRLGESGGGVCNAFLLPRIERLARSSSQCAPINYSLPKVPYSTHIRPLHSARGLAL